MCDDGVDACLEEEEEEEEEERRRRRKETVGGLGVRKREICGARKLFQRDVRTKNEESKLGDRANEELSPGRDERWEIYSHHRSKIDTGTRNEKAGFDGKRKIDAQVFIPADALPCV